jgi:hypothetical protein
VSAAVLLAGNLPCESWGSGAHPTAPAGLTVHELAEHSPAAQFKRRRAMRALLFDCARRGLVDRDEERYHLTADAQARFGAALSCERAENAWSALAEGRQP